MKVREITIRRGRTLNHGNFESSRIDITATAEIEPGETPDDVLERLDRRIKEKLDQKITELHQ